MCGGSKKPRAQPTQKRDAKNGAAADLNNNQKAPGSKKTGGKGGTRPPGETTKMGQVQGAEQNAILASKPNPQGVGD